MCNEFLFSKKKKKKRNLINLNPGIKIMLHETRCFYRQIIQKNLILTYIHIKCLRFPFFVHFLFFLLSHFHRSTQILHEKSH